jgi:hypothetical protein
MKVVRGTQTRDLSPFVAILSVSPYYLNQHKKGIFSILKGS